MSRNIHYFFYIWVSSSWLILKSSSFLETLWLPYPPWAAGFRILFPSSNAAFFALSLEIYFADSFYLDYSPRIVPTMSGSAKVLLVTAVLFSLCLFRFWYLVFWRPPHRKRRDGPSPSVFAILRSTSTAFSSAANFAWHVFFSDSLHSEQNHSTYLVWNHSV